MNSTFELYHMEKLFEYDYRIKISLSVAFSLILAFGVVTQRQLISYLKSKNKRLINKIIYVNLILKNILVPPIIFFSILAIWIHNKSQFIGGKYGCYVIMFAINICISIDRSHSFFTNMFRYICIVQDEKLKKYNIQPKVSYCQGFIHNSRSNHMVIIFQNNLLIILFHVSISPSKQFSI